MKIKIGRRPQAQVERERKWWREHRDHTELFDEEYEGALRWLVVSARYGQPWPTERRPHLKRVLLPKTRNHLYYVVEEDDAVVVILSLWGAQRKRTPKL